MVCPGVFFQFLFWISLMKTGLQQRVVTHIISTMCVVRQSTVLIPCSYGHSRHESLYIEEWVYQRSPEDSDRVVSQDPAFEGRVEIVNSTGGGGGNCSLLLKNVRDSDAGIFSIRFRSGVSLQTWSKSSGVSLKVTDAEVEVISQYDVVTEGDWLVFFCGSCVPSIIVPTYIWRKDGRLYCQNYGTNQLDLNSVRLEDAGRYSCMLSGHEGLNSSSVAVKVRPGDPPKNTTIRISPSAVITEGDSVTLTCSSKSNPLVHNYSWFKVNETSSVGSGQTYSITNINSSHSGWFYCEAQNKYGSQKSAAISVKVTGVQGGLDTVYWILAGCGGLFFFILIIILFIWKKLRDGGSEVSMQNQGNGLGGSEGAGSSNDAALYSLVGLSANQSEAAECADAAGVQYASVQHFRNKERMNENEQNDRQITNLKRHRTSDPHSSTDVIYSLIYK